MCKHFIMPQFYKFTMKELKNATKASTKGEAH